MLCLQGGAEFGPDCRQMDGDLLRVAGEGPVVVSALAGAPGREYRTAGDNAVRHFCALGAPDVRVAPDVREDPEGALAALGEARLLVLPGGSPARLLEVLRSTAVGELVAERLRDGAVVLGSSAGAMVLCAWTVLPDRSGPDGPVVVPGLGLADRLLVLPHWTGASDRTDWLQAVRRTVPPEVLVVGLPEQSGVLVDDGGLTAVGARSSYLVGPERELPVGERWPR